MHDSPYDPAEFVARLKEVIEVKRLDPKGVHERTGIPYDQLDRLGTGPKGPSASKLKDIVFGLELDANFLLDTDERYRTMTALQRAANMSLDRYLARRERYGTPVGDIEASELRHVAHHSFVPPLWSAEWEIHHERMRTAAAARPEPPRPEAPPHFRRRRSIQ